MNATAASLRNGNDIVETSVSVDGIWQKRYGHNSLLGASFVLIDNGQVHDYVIKSKKCQTCNRNQNACDTRKEQHKPVCEINQSYFIFRCDGKRSVAVVMFINSIDQRNLNISGKVWRRLSISERGLYRSHLNTHGCCPSQLQMQFYLYMIQLL